jgi:ubiquitin-protein ligase
VRDDSFYRPLGMYKNSFRDVIERAYESCRRNRNQAWILEPVEDMVGSFRGILFGRSDSPVAGCAFAFTLEIDAKMLAEPPRVCFEEKLAHPFILDGHFCFPLVGASSLSCRGNSIDTIMDNLVKFFFLKFDRTWEQGQSFLNADAWNSFRNTPDEFWGRIRARGRLPDRGGSQ